MKDFNRDSARKDIYLAFETVAKPVAIDAWNDGQHAKNLFIEFVQSFASWSDISSEAFDKAPGKV